MCSRGTTQISSSFLSECSPDLVSPDQLLGHQINYLADNAMNNREMKSNNQALIIGVPRNTKKCHELTNQAITQPIMQLITEE